MEKETVKTVEELKEFCRQEMITHRPDFTEKDFQSIWSAMAPILKTEASVRAFLAGYNSKIKPK